MQELQIVSCSRASLKDFTKPKHILETWIQIPTFPCLRVHHDYVYKPENMTLLSKNKAISEEENSSLSLFYLSLCLLSIFFTSASRIHLFASEPQWMTQFLGSSEEPLKYVRRKSAFYPITNAKCSHKHKRVEE